MAIYIDDLTDSQAQTAIQPQVVEESTSKTPEQRLTESIAEEEKKSLEDFSYARSYLNDLVTKWSFVEQQTEGNRIARDIDIDVDVLRQQGDIEEDECFIPERIINSNIEREMPSYINYLKNSRRVAIFSDKLDPTFDTQLLEDAFTKGMTYKGWTRPFFKVIDGAMTHGWASVEVVYDPSKPLQVGIEYIAHEDLIFPMDSKDIQNSSCILRRYRPTPLQLKTWVKKFGFNLVQVGKIIEKYAEKTNKDKTVNIYKRLCKSNGKVYVSWFSLESGCDDWLLAPKSAYAGIDEIADKQTMVSQPTMMPHPLDPSQMIQTGTQQVPQTVKDWAKSDLTNYPIFLLPYKETEKPLVFDYLGRVFYDRNKQEAQTAIVTAFVNGINRAQQVYASAATDSVSDGKPAKQLANIKWADGCIFDKPMTFWHKPYPDAMILKALDYFDVSNSQDIGQTDFAATNRQDSRKTATEIKAAENQSGLLDSVDLTLFSEFCREVFSFSWLICRSRALQNQIKFLLVAPSSNGQTQPIGMNTPPPNAANAPMPNAAPPAVASPAIQSIVDALGTYQQEQSGYVNDVDTIVRDYDVRAAGDVDVIQKQELEQSMMQDWPVVQNTPLASRFLSDLIKLKYPEDGAVYSEILQQQNPKNAVIQSLGALVKGILAMPAVKQEMEAQPQLKQQLASIQQQAQQALQTP